jgi:hypothetical protein
MVKRYEKKIPFRTNPQPTCFRKPYSSNELDVFFNRGVASGLMGEFNDLTIGGVPPVSARPSSRLLVWRKIPLRIFAVQRLE